MLLNKAIRDFGVHIYLIEVRVHAGHRLVDRAACVEGVRALSEELPFCD